MTNAQAPNTPNCDPCTGALWLTIVEEAKKQAAAEPALASFLHATILNHDSLKSALSYHLATKLGGAEINSLQVREIIEQALSGDASIADAVCADLHAVFERDSACDSFLYPLLFFKGFQALQSYRIAHWLWMADRQYLALFFQSRIALTFGVDIHPAAKLGKGIMLDHATGIVIGETTVVEDDVSIMQEVTLGGTGKECGDRHPKVRRGVLISAGAKILGNIEIGENAKIGAGSVVLKPVAAHTTVAGVPAVVVGQPHSMSPALDMNHQINSDQDWG
ncbi:MAG: serine O-acetyltransferase [Marinagarivorans sp.]|nr:serine O-acetyltransferase [Marinagarivorans sp.]